MPPEDQAELACWRNEDDTRRWQKAVVLLGSYQHRTIEELSRQTEISQESILQWIASYKCSGLSRLRTPMRPPNRFEAANQQKRENLLRLIQQRPAVFGINRASWKIADLSSVYQRVYGTPLSGHPIRDHLKKMGYKFEKSRQRLISPDPDFSAKVERIKTILSRLGPDEKFFSIDEYGPVNIRLKTGWSLTPRGAVRLIPEFQKSKGSFIMTAALELSTNQITHFYSASKDSREIIRLIDLLVAQYRGHKNIYLSWDAAGWHCSNSLKAHLQHINHKNYRLRQGTAAVGVVPLPSYAPYLNVIESVFSGMAKAVIHNGDYASVAECQAAIDRYFQERNAYYRANPQKAGKKIWGREIVPPVFDEFQNCKNRLKKDKDAR
jgi:transposase